MTRPLGNAGLAKLCQKKAEETGARFDKVDVAFLCRVNLSSVYRYAAGKLHAPRLEQKIANVFGLSPKQLRRKLSTGRRKA